MKKKKKLKIGLALGSGGAKGIAHIGVLKVLEEHGIKPDLIIGTSMGAVIGAGYSLGYTVNEMEEIARTKLAGAGDIYGIKNWHVFHESMFSDRTVSSIYHDVVKNKTFKDCTTPFVALACDLEEGKEVFLQEGKLLDAVKASSAIPGVFPPVFIDGRYMVDGALINPTPVDYLRKQGMDIVIGVHNPDLACRQFISGIAWEKNYRKLSGFKKQKRTKIEQAKLNLKTMVEVLVRTLEIIQETNLRLTLAKAHPDVIIEPDTSTFGVTNFAEADRTILIGEKVMRKKIEKLLKIIEKKEQQL